MLRMEYTLDAWIELWQREMKYGSIDDRLHRAEKWNAYYTFLAEKIEKQPHQKPQEEYFAGILKQMGYLLPTDMVLDIGAGTGRYAFDFAGICQSVTAIDGCEANVRLIRDRARHMRLENIICENVFWEEFETDQVFDITFSSMCPVICSKDDIMKLEHMTKRKCVLITIMNGSYDRHRMVMLKDLQIQPDGTLSPAHYYYNILYLMGRCPEVFCQEIEVEKEISVPEIMEQYPVYFEIFGISRDRSKAYLRDYLDRHAEGGKLKEISKYRMAMICWSPKKL